MDKKILEKQITTLELDKILKILSGYSAIPDAVENCCNIKPYFEIEEVERLLTQTGDAYMLIARFGAPSFGGASNCNNALARAEMGGVLTPAELLKIAQLLHVIRTVKDWKERFSSNIITSLDGLFGGLMQNKYFEEKIFTSIDSEEEINDNASAKLSDIRRKIRSSSASVREKLEKIIKSQSSSKFLQDAIVTQRDGRYVVPVKSEHRGEVPGLIHDTSSTGATLFIEPMAVVEINNEIRVLKNKEKEEIERILTELSGEAAEFSENIRISYEALVELDVIFSKAKYAFDIKGIIPSVNVEGVCDLKNARHPLLDKSKVVPISVELGIDFDTLIITGPNTGGKTVTIKTLGLLTLMAMCGLMIPADEGSQICVFSGIFSDIGDEQSIEQSLSTFSSHMKRIVEILQQADERSLVLLDELGAGTDPVEGAALAKAIISELINKGTKSVTTTHYAELKSFAIDSFRVENACCEFDVSTLKPTYKLMIGVPGRSNAFAISQKLGISEDIIENAKTMVSEDNLKFEAVVSSLEEARRIAEQEREEAGRIRSELQRQKDYNSRMQEKFRKEREDIIEKAHTESNRIIEYARNESNLLLNQLEEMKKKLNAENSRETIASARDAARKAIKNLESKSGYTENLDEDYTLPRELQIGDTVYVKELGNKATVSAIGIKGGKVEVTAGLMKLRVSIDSLRLVDEHKSNEKRKPAKRNVTGIKSRAERQVESELDLRGMASDEAVMEVERFIDNALLSGIETVRIIHGKGTGVLRKAVHDELKRNKSVRTYRLGVFGEGESGVTIAELK